MELQVREAYWTILITCIYLFYLHYQCLFSIISFYARSIVRYEFSFDDTQLLVGFTLKTYKQRRTISVLDIHWYKQKKTKPFMHKT